MAAQTGRGVQVGPIGGRMLKQVPLNGKAIFFPVIFSPSAPGNMGYLSS